MTKKSNQIKFTKEELSGIREVRNSFNNITTNFGNLEVQRIQTEQRLSAIEQQKVIAENEYNQVIQQEVELLNNLNEKYGQGSLDLEKGVFTPIEEKK
jgi:allophanate hydrolase subunit 1